MPVSPFITPSEVWKFGTQERTSQQTPIVLGVFMQPNVGAARFSTFRAQGTAAGYAVTIGKTLVCTRLLMHANIANQPVYIGYSDSDRGFNNAADGANPVDLDIHSSGEGLITAMVINTLYDWDVYYRFPAGKFPRLGAGIGAGGTFVGLLIGFEE